MGLRWIGVICAAALACVDGGPRDAVDPAAVAVRDSAGVQIIESTGAMWDSASAWRLSPEPEVSIGVVQGTRPYEFSGIVGLTRLSDGRIVVLDEQTKELRFFAADGRHLMTLGGAGQGPGEFSSPGRLQRLQGDTLQVEDHLTRIRYAPDGTLASQTRLDWGAVRQMGEFYLECGVAPNLLGDDAIGCSGREPWPHDAGGDERPRTASTYVRIPAALDRLDTLATVPSPGSMIVSFRGEPALLPGTWFPGGALAFGGDPVRFASTRTDGYGIDVRELDGTLRRVVRRLDGMRPPTPSELEPWLARDPSPSLRRLVKADFDDLTPPDSIPLVTSLLLDSENRIWTRIVDPALGDGVWHDVFDAEGRYLGPVRFPDRFEIFEIGADYVLGVRRDELDVERVELYRLVGPPAPRGG